MKKKKKKKYKQEKMPINRIVLFVDDRTLDMARQRRITIFCIMRWALRMILVFFCFVYSKLNREWFLVAIFGDRFLAIRKLAIVVEEEFMSFSCNFGTDYEKNRYGALIFSFYEESNLAVASTSFLILPVIRVINRK